MSDHDIIEIVTKVGDNGKKITKNENENDEELDLRQLNFHHEKVDWSEIKKYLNKCLGMSYFIV